MSRCPKRPGGHNWILQGQKNENDTVGSATFTGLWRHCNFCDIEDHDTLLCEGKARGWNSSWHTCGAVARFESPYCPGLYPAVDADGNPLTTAIASDRAPDGKTHHYCKVHDPLTEAKRRAESEARGNAKYQAELAGRRLGWHGKSALELLRELKDWADHNRDLVQADEWLGSIVARVDPQVRKMEGEDR
jgi:hypothetical protein